MYKKYTRDNNETYSISSVIKDCKKLNKVIKKYACYEYYVDQGYDFELINKNLIDDCIDAQINNRIFKDEFVDIIIRNYGFINDGHMNINYKNSLQNHICLNINGAIRERNDDYDEEEVFLVKDDYVYLKISNFMDFKLDSEKIENYKTEIRKSKNLIFDLRGNRGGHENGLKLLMDTFVDDNKLRFELYSKYIRSKKNTLIFPFNLELYSSANFLDFIFNFIETNESNISNIKFDYRGNIYVLMNNKTASASEVFINCLLTHMINKPILIGQMSAGALVTGNPVSCLLPHTNVIIQIPTTYVRVDEVINEQYAGESKGFRPDIKTKKGDEINVLKNRFGFDLFIE